MNLAENHEHHIDDLVGTMIEEQLLEIEIRVERDVEQAQLLVRNVLSVLIDIVLAKLPAFSNLSLSEGAQGRHVVQVHHLDLVFILVAQLCVAARALSRATTSCAPFPRAARRRSQRSAPPAVRFFIGCLVRAPT